MVDRLLPRSVQSPRMLAAEAAIDRILRLDFTLLDVYNIDTVHAGALYHLADQFNVLGYRGWLLADTVAKKRELIKQAIDLHRSAGTPYAIKRALEVLGYPNAEIIENPAQPYDGAFSYDGALVYQGESYGKFIVVLSENDSYISKERIALILRLIEEWKNLRSELIDLRIADRSLIENPFFYDTGAIVYDGSQTYDGTLENFALP